MSVIRKGRMFSLGGSSVITLPRGLVKRKQYTLAADRLILIDPRGEYPPEKLLELLEGHIEPVIWLRGVDKKDEKT